MEWWEYLIVFGFFGRYSSLVWKIMPPFFADGRTTHELVKILIAFASMCVVLLCPAHGARLAGALVRRPGPS
jgi:hypothetical protein